MNKEKWYRTGAVADETGLSQYRIRALAKEGLIESRSSNGMLYIPGSALERLKNNGPPAMPAREPVEDDPPEAPDDAPPLRTRTPPALPPARNQLTEELYAEPSRQLARQKEKVVGLSMAVQVKELQRQIREGERAERDQRDRQAKEKQDADARRKWLDYAMERVPQNCDLHTDIHEKVEGLLSRIDSNHPGARKMVDAIVDQALRPMRHREEQDRAVDQTIKSLLRFAARKTEWGRLARSEATKAVVQLGESANYTAMCDAARAVVGSVNTRFDHERKIEMELNCLSLPSGARAEDHDDAKELARPALYALPPRTPDHKFKVTVQTAIGPVFARIVRRNAHEELQRLESRHKSRIDFAVLCLSLPWAATSEDQENAKRQVRAALEQFPATAHDREMEDAKAATLGPIVAAIKAREEARRNAEAASRAAQQQQANAERRADAQMCHVWYYLIELEKQEEIFFDDGWDQLRTDNSFKKAIRPGLVKLLREHPSLTDTELKEEIEELIDEHWYEVVDR